MDREPLVVTPADRDRALDVVGTKVTVLASNAVTGGYEITLQEGDEGTGPPPHKHGWDEAFYVLKGSVEFTYGGKTMLALPGTLVHLPGGTVHSFRYGTGGGQILEMTGANGTASKLFTSLDKDVPPGPPDVSKIIEVLAKNGVTAAL